MVQVLNYYGGGNTSKGFVEFYDSIFQGLDNIYSLNGGCNIYKNNLLKDLISKSYSNNNIEIINSSIDTEEIEGFIVRDLKIAIVNGTPIHKGKLCSAGVNVIDIDLDKAIDHVKLSSFNQEIVSLKKDFEIEVRKAHNAFFTGLKIHDEWENYYYKNMDFQKANNFTQKIIDMIIPDEVSFSGMGRVYDRYLGAATPVGSRDFVPNLTEGVRRYFIKGRPGTGKSTMLKKIAKAATDKGYDVEIYHCGFDPNSLDMVISRELGFAIFDSTAPHEYFPSRPSDEVIDNYKELVNLGTDEKYSVEFKDIASRYKNQIKSGTAYLANAKKIKDKIDNIYYNVFNINEGDIIVRAYIHK